MGRIRELKDELELVGLDGLGDPGPEARGAEGLADARLGPLVQAGRLLGLGVEARRLRGVLLLGDGRQPPPELAEAGEQRALGQPRHLALLRLPCARVHHLRTLAAGRPVDAEVWRLVHLRQERGLHLQRCRAQRRGGKARQPHWNSSNFDNVVSPPLVHFLNTTQPAVPAHSSNLADTKFHNS